MLSQQIKKLCSTTRSLLLIRNKINEARFVRPCLCKCNLHPGLSRSISTAAPLHKEQNKKSIRFSTAENIKTQEKNEGKKTDPVQNEELLEKLIADLSTDIHQKNRVYKNDLLRVVSRVEEMDFTSKKQGLLLLRCCTELLPDETPLGRMQLAERIWGILKGHTKFTVDHYNELLNVYLANNRSVVANKFISQMAPVKPESTTYELLLRVIGEAGDLNQATEVLANMKALNMPASVDVFNSLVICQGKSGNLQNIQEVLTMMTSLMLDRTIDTYVALAKALAWNKKCDQVFEEMTKAVNDGLHFEERHVLEIVKCLADAKTYTHIPRVLQYLPKETLSCPSISPYMQSVATLLVFQNHPLAALEIYKCLPLPSFGPRDDKGLHGRSLVRDCVRAGLPSNVIYLISQELMGTGRNPIALQNASEAALQQGKIPLALEFFSRMKQMGLPIRPHYFWPVMLHSSKVYGEKGIMNTLVHMVSMDVMPDYETIMEYTLPFVSFTSPQNLMKKFLDTGVTVTIVLTPMMVTLLNTGQTRAASEICELFHGKVDAEKILKSLVKSLLMSMDVKSTVHLLEDMSTKALEKNKDWVGRFLCTFVQHKKVQEDCLDFLNVVKALQPTKLRISSSSSDFCLSRLPENLDALTIETFRNSLLDITDEKQVDEGDHTLWQMPHPKNMNEESLKAHLIELEAKGMNTRGVLRKLLQEYCRKGDLKSARDIVTKCQKEGVYLSAGMKAAIFDMHVKLGELELAENVLADLNKTSPNFTLDEFKVIDFATLMVYRQQIDKAFELIKEQSKCRKVMGGRNISMNCWRLLDAVSAKCNYAETLKMFNLILSLGYCTPGNAVLGPLIRVHLKNDNIKYAVAEHVRIASTYHKTPLKHELLCKILTMMGDGIGEDNFITQEKSNGWLKQLAQTVLHWNKKVHGSGDVQLTMMTALAEVGYRKTLRKMFLDPTVKVHPEALLRRCERFADERKVKALLTIADCTRDLKQFDVADVYDLILEVYQRDDQCDKALSLWIKMQEQEITPSKKFARGLCALMKSNQREEPTELMVYLDRSPQKASNN